MHSLRSSAPSRVALQRRIEARWILGVIPLRTTPPVSCRCFVPTRIGVHHGPVLYRDGDYLGATVNVAARITSEAVAHQILTTADIATGASGSDVTFGPPGPRRLRGIANDIEIYELHTTTRNDDDSTWPTDPVCGMHLSPSDIDARLDLGGRERVFCSSRCLQLFVDAPGRYAAS